MMVAAFLRRFEPEEQASLGKILYQLLTFYGEGGGFNPTTTAISNVVSSCFLTIRAELSKP